MDPPPKALLCPDCEKTKNPEAPPCGHACLGEQLKHEPLPVSPVAPRTSRCRRILFAGLFWTFLYLLLGLLWFLASRFPGPAPPHHKDPYPHLNESSTPSLIVRNDSGRFLCPHGIAVDHARGVIFVVENCYSHVNMLDLQGSIIGAISKNGFRPGELTWPAGIAIDPKTRNIFVADYYNERVQIFSEEGRYLSHFATASRPGNLALDKAGRIYVALSSYQVQVFERGGTRQLSLWGKKGSGEGEFDGLWGIAVNRQGEVIVCDGTNPRLSVFTREGRFLRALGEGEVAQPGTIHLDRDGNIIVADNTRDAILLFDPEGKKIKEFGQAAGMGHPHGISVDKMGRIVVSDIANNRVLFF